MIRELFAIEKGVLCKKKIAAYSFNLQFQYILARWEVSASDSHVLQSALTKEDKLQIPEGFANIQGFLAPFCGVRYHLSKFAGGDNPRNAKELYNHRHSSARNVIERIFGILKARFAILRIVPPYPFETQVKIVIACCIIHNHIRKDNKNDQLFSEME